MLFSQGDTVQKERDESHNIIVAHDLNGFVEAIELKGNRFCLGLKWHPEIMENDVLMKNLFKEFVKSCNRYHNRNNYSNN